MALSDGDIVYFASDAGDPATRRRMRQIAGEGYRPLGVMFERARREGDVEPSWPMIHLGVMADAHYGARLPKLLRAAVTLFTHRRRLSGAKLVFARNLDMLALAWGARLFRLHAAPIVYDVFDVRGVLLGGGLGARLLRLCERRLLRRCRLLVVSSPAFLTEYFAPRLGYRGPWRLVENRVDPRLFANIYIRPQSTMWTPASTEPLTLGWIGLFRCERSAELLRRVAEAMPEIRIQLSGAPSFCSLDAFLERFSRLGNVVYTGPYAFPEGLGGVYRHIDINWCLDLPEDETGRWLLPNRLYEGGACGVPALAEAVSATGAQVQELGVGWTTAPDADAIIHLLRNEIPATYAAVKDRAMTISGTTFIDDHDLAAVFEAIELKLSKGVAETGSGGPIG